MSRPTTIQINTDALLHNVVRIRECAPGKKIIAMVKANAYGCGFSNVIPTIEGRVDFFGVACLEEALVVGRLSSKPCILFEGVYTPEELYAVETHQFQCVIHSQYQLEWLLHTQLSSPIRMWIKINTGMNRLGFIPADVPAVLGALRACPWVMDDIGIMTHLASADEVNNPQNQQQLELFHAIELPELMPCTSQSIANSAALVGGLDESADCVRPGIMLYGISPFADQTGNELKLIPVMRFCSQILAIQHCQTGARVGYGGAWTGQRQSRIGIVAVGYGDGYPRHIEENTPVWINGGLVPIVGRVSMDMLTVDLTERSDVEIGTAVELWGEHLPIETIARAAGTIAYELICQITPRARGVYNL